jgi:hypothetical protein
MIAEVDVVASLTAYRKRIGRFEEWHFQPDCPDWPHANYIEQRTMPVATELCIDCIELYNRSSPDPQLEA